MPSFDFERFSNLLLSLKNALSVFKTLETALNKFDLSLKVEQDQYKKFFSLPYNFTRKE